MLDIESTENKKRNKNTFMCLAKIQYDINSNYVKLLENVLDLGEHM